MLLTTTGRRTGKPRTTPVFYLRDDKRLVVCNVNPGFERPNPWTLNLRALPVARVQIGQDVRSYRAREATAAEIERYWPQLVLRWPAYRTHFERSGQRFIFVLEPLPQGAPPASATPSERDTAFIALGADSSASHGGLGNSSARRSGVTLSRP